MLLKKEQQIIYILPIFLWLEKQVLQKNMLVDM